MKTRNRAWYGVPYDGRAPQETIQAIDAEGGRFRVSRSSPAGFPTVPYFLLFSLPALRVPRAGVKKKRILSQG